MKFTYLKTPIRRYTFDSNKIRRWVENNVEGLVLNLYAGKNKLSCKEVRNDINSDMKDIIVADYYKDAHDFLTEWEGEKFGTVLLDPPYSERKAMTKYGGVVMSPFNSVKMAIPNILVPGGIVITFGYHSVSMGEKRGFVIEHICLINHGGAIHDTIATIERHQPKINFSQKGLINNEQEKKV